MGIAGVENVGQNVTWRWQAECLGMDPELFHPDTPAGVAACKAVCAMCRVREDCLEDALSDTMALGVQGGLTLTERTLLLRGRGVTLKRQLGVAEKPIDHGTDAGYNAHRRRGVPMCDECRDAHRVKSQQFRDKQKETNQ